MLTLLVCHIRLALADGPATSAVWQQPIVQVTNSGAESGGAVGRALGVDSANRVHLVYTEHSGSGWDALYTHSDDGGVSWSEPRDIADSPLPAVSPNLAVGPDDAVHVAWIDRREGDSRIYYARSLDGGDSWETPRNVAGAFPMDAAVPSIAVDDRNRVHIAFHIGDVDAGDITRVYYVRSLDGGATFGAPVRLNTADAPAAFPRFNVAGVSGDLLAIAWRDNRRDPDWDSFVAVSRDGGDTFVEIPGIQTSLRDWDPDVVVDAAGTIHLSCMTYRPDTISIDYSRSTDGGETWTEPVTLTEVRSRFPFWAYDWRSSVLWLFWKDERDVAGPNDYRADLAARYSTDSGISWSDFERVTDLGDVEVKFPSPTVFADGRPCVMWSDRSLGNEREDIYFRARGSAAGTGRVQLLSPNGGEKFRRGDSVEITWSTAGDIGTQDLLLSADNGATFDQLLVAGLPGSARSYTWLIPADQRKGKNYRVQVLVHGGSGQWLDASDSSFRIRKAR
jgi:hypothetical protein